MRDYEPDQLDEQALRRELDQIRPDAGWALGADKGYFSPVALPELTALLARHPRRRATSWRHRRGSVGHQATSRIALRDSHQQCGGVATH